MGQLGVKTVGAQLATEPPPSADTTKDRQYYIIGTSTAGTTTPPNWDRYNMWGIEHGFTSSSAGNIAANKIQAIPCWFNRTGTIDKIIGVFSSSLAAPVKVVMALYGNNLDGEIWPGLKVAQSSQVILDSGGSSAVIQWTAGYQVTAGTLLWLAISVGDNSLAIAGRAAGANEFPGLMGTTSIGTAGAAPSGFDPSPNAGIKTVDSAYNATAPSPFPTTNPVLFVGLSGGDTIPVYSYRFVKA